MAENHITHSLGSQQLERVGVCIFHSLLTKNIVSTRSQHCIHGLLREEPLGLQQLLQGCLRVGVVKLGTLEGDCRVACQGQGPGFGGGGGCDEQQGVLLPNQHQTLVAHACAVRCIRCTSEQHTGSYVCGCVVLYVSSWRRSVEDHHDCG